MGISDKSHARRHGSHCMSVQVLGQWLHPTEQSSVAAFRGSSDRSHSLRINKYPSPITFRRAHHSICDIASESKVGCEVVRVVRGGRAGDYHDVMQNDHEERGCVLPTVTVVSFNQGILADMFGLALCDSSRRVRTKT